MTVFAFWIMVALHVLRNRCILRPKSRTWTGLEVIKLSITHVNAIFENIPRILVYLNRLET